MFVFVQPPFFPVKNKHPDMNIGILDISSDCSKLSFSGNAAVVLCKYTAQLRGRGRGRDIVFFYLMYLSFLSKAVTAGILCNSVQNWDLGC